MEFKNNLNGENSVILDKDVCIMVLSLLVIELWLLVDTPTLGKFKQINVSTFNIKVLVRYHSQPYFSDATTEVWELGDENNKIISPSLPRNHYYYGIALVPVNSDFCRK